MSFVAVAVLTEGARAQVEAWRDHGVSSQPGLGMSVAFLGDLDGDGVPDFVAGGTSATYSPPGSGRAMVFSGASGSLRFDLMGAVGASFGAAVASAGDVDADGVDDFAVGAPMDGNGGDVYVYSGATGALLRTLAGASTGSQFGQSLANLGDVDGDGVDDLAVGAPLDSSGGTQLGLVVICSGASGATLASLVGSTIGGGFGSVVDDAGDVDHDGIHDLLVVEQADSTTGTTSGSVRIYSGASFSLLSAWTLGPVAGGWTASSAGDVNSDGTVDFIVGNSQWPITKIAPQTSGVGGVWVYDGVTGAVLDSFTQFLKTGAVVSGAGDVNGDGFDDFAFGLDDLHSLDGFRVVSGKDGAVLASGLDKPGSIRGGVDVNGDGVSDLLLGTPLDHTNGGGAGAGKLFDAVQDTVLVAGDSTVRFDRLGQTSALLDDVDGDGTRDLLVGIGLRGWSTCAAQVLSGRDGSELRFHSDGTVDDGYAQKVAALPDLDGDSIGEYAIAFPGASSKNQHLVEIRSGASGSLLRTLSPSSGGSGGFGAALAVGLQPSGAVELAVGDPNYPTSTVYVFDAATGGFVVSASYASDGFGTSIAFLGDVDGDGTGDWAAGAPYGGSAGKAIVEVFSGLNGGTIQQLALNLSTEFGTSVCGVGDVSGDGVPDLVAGAPADGGGDRGIVYLFSGATWTVLRTWTGASSNLFLGSSATTVGDVNRDGLDDFLLGGWGKALLISGGSGAVLYRFDGALQDDYFGGTSAGVAAPGSVGSMNGDSIPDVAIGARDDRKNGLDAGRISLYFLDDLYLQIDPPTASAGNSVSFTTSGGPAGNASALFLLAFDGNPLVALLDLTTFGSAGVWSVSGAVPPGLAGHTLTFGSFAIGFGGNVVATQPMTLTLK